MVQRHRHDRPGQRHHIYNRGPAKRVLFPDDRAKKRFIALLLCARRREEIAIEAFSILDTHYHLLARSTDVPIGYPMMRIQNAYSRYINRRLHRDGPMIRGRFGSSPVNSLTYAFTLVRYIDQNPVKAGICDEATRYHFGTARVYVTRTQGPAWLDRRLVHRFLEAMLVRPDSFHAGYRQLFGTPLSEGEREIVDRRANSPIRGRDDQDRIHGRPPLQVAAWMRRKARLADGLAPWPPIAGSFTVLAAIDDLDPRLNGLRFQVTRTRWEPDPLLRVGLLHDVAGMGCDEIARTLDCASSTAGRRLRAHRVLLVTSNEYALLAGEGAAAALRATYPLGPLA